MIAVTPVPVHPPLRVRRSSDRIQSLQACSARLLRQVYQPYLSDTALSQQSLCGASHQPKKIVLL